MKKNNLLILAVAALGFAACANDETIAENQGLQEANTISFRPVITGNMRTANSTGVKTAFENGDILYVNAIRDSKMYFQDQFTKQESGFHSADKHYWPADIATNNIYFTAFWGVPYKTVSSDNQYSDYDPKDEFNLNEAYSVADAVGSQMDILYAQSAAISSKPNDGGVMLNFRHMLSQIIVNVANSEANLSINGTGVKITNVTKTGTFQYSAETETTAGSTMPKGSWTFQTTNQTYTMNTSDAPIITALNLSGKQARTAITGYTPLILMPQKLTAATAYNAAEANPASPTAISSSTAPAVNGSYIALQMTITDKNSGITIVANQWCVWPIDTDWEPGKKYTYTVNAGSGGYQPIDRNGNEDLDPVLQNSVIWFLPTCSIDDWVEETEINVSEPAFVSTIAAGGTKNINVSATAAGHFSITVTGIADANLPPTPISVTTAGNIVGTPSAVRVGTTAYITGVINAETGSGKTSTFTLTDGAGTPVVTTINLIQPAP